MSHVHVKRWRADDDAPELVFGPYLGTVNELGTEAEADDDGLVDVAGNPIRREPARRKPFGFHVRECE